MTRRELNEKLIDILYAKLRQTNFLDNIFINHDIYLDKIDILSSMIIQRLKYKKMLHRNFIVAQNTPEKCVVLSFFYLDNVRSVIKFFDYESRTSSTQNYHATLEEWNRYTSEKVSRDGTVRILRIE